MIKKVKCLTVAFIIFITGLAVTGCNEGAQNSKPGAAAKNTENEIRKQRLLGRISVKYSDAQAHYELGKIYQFEGLWSQAESEYQTTLSLDPFHGDAQAAIVKVLISSGNTQKANSLAKSYFDKTSLSPMGSLKLALGFQDQGLDDYALKAYLQAVSLAPNSAPINREIGYYYLKKGDTAKAQDYFTRSIHYDPYQPDIAEELGKMGVEVKVPKKRIQGGTLLDRMVKEQEKEMSQK